ncbi:MAG: glycosyltransferase family 4 protein [Chloroflexi bacterium]|uniref:glycosyltransferase family 4 protein n=1 Tax=Candidatus Flexifilum breve TaxID=3140694 RepID=UPI0031367451|nr:glycosyltransferase family 4 protein [Chloroflexota bacterium]
MKIIVSSLGRFHAFDLAQQLLRLESLARLYTGYPRWKIDPGLRSYTHTFPWLLVPEMAILRYSPALVERIHPLTITTFDRWVSKNIGDADVFTFMSQFGLYGQQEAQRRGMKTVCIRSSAHIEEQDRLLREEYALHGRKYPGISRWTVRRELQEYAEADLIDVCSTYAYDTFRARGFPAEKLFLSPLSADLSLFRPQPKTDDVFRVLYAGTLSLQKGIGYLLSACADLKLPNFELILAGPLHSEAKDLLSRYSGQFQYLGVVPRVRLSQTYAQASVLVLPSIQDGFGMVMAQAMACGVPVIATTNTGSRDLFTDGVEGFIVPIRDSQAIHEKILHLYHNPELRDKMAQAALRRVQSVGGWDEYGERAIQAYSRLLK